MQTAPQKPQDVQILHAFPRNESEQVQMALKKYKGRHYIDLRIWFLGEEDSVYRPTKKGISLSLDQLVELRKGVDRLTKACERLKMRQAEEIGV